MRSLLTLATKAASRRMLCTTAVRTRQLRLPLPSLSAVPSYSYSTSLFASSGEGKSDDSVLVTSTKSANSTQDSTVSAAAASQDDGSNEKVLISACGDVNEDGDDDDDDMEEEEMFVDAHETFQFHQREWGGPRRGGRLPEPTRFGDWERKGRCTDF
uniref:Succinate dehydrogenase assembly factor 4, mitochondrial n=2 Tax=Craspedostauros australis TaxID=1486917 RepID=A0A7S0F6R7_9STRA|mmetsp:Transcript_8756/g.23639  ORF Transcript_8756/g.23639 Transcript_8756/m.23639 type:complete len:157 (+) Transcript_8756:118-588(+)